MKRSYFCIFILIFTVFLASISQAKPQHNVTSVTKPKTKAVQKQLVKNAKTVVSTVKKDLRIQESAYRKARNDFLNARKADAAARKKMVSGKTAEIREEGRVAVSQTKRRAAKTKSAYFAADKELMSTRFKFINAKNNLNGLQKLGWKEFFAQQKQRVDEVRAAQKKRADEIRAAKELSVNLPRVQRNADNVADLNKFNKDVYRAEKKRRAYAKR